MVIGWSTREITHSIDGVVGALKLAEAAEVLRIRLLYERLPNLESFLCSCEGWDHVVGQKKVVDSDLLFLTAA